jgi:excinuclease ABC subunit C
VEGAVRFLEGRGRDPLRRLETRLARAVDDLDFEYAALVRDRLERLRRFREELAGWRGRVESLTFVYRAPGFHGADRVYLVRNGLVKAALPHPKSRKARSTVAAKVREVFDVRGRGESPVERRPPRGATALTPHEAAEILFVARWFRLNPEELERTRTPEAWLEDAGRPRSTRDAGGGRTDEPAATAPGPGAAACVSPAGPSSSPAPTRPSRPAARTDANC